VISITKTGPAFQVGKGANGKNLNFGASGWFNWTVTQQPTAGAITATGQGDINVDIIECQPLGSIGDRVWKDLDGDGVQDAGEVGINGVKVELLYNNAVIATTTTAGDGTYTFTNLAAATYKVRVVSSTVPSGYSQTYDLDGVATAHIATVVLAAGQNRTDADFGYRPPAAPGTGTIGYWKTHPAAWPVQQITLGGVTYSKSQAISILGQSSRGDKTIDLAKQLIAAKLNVIVGNESSCIDSTISAADAWLVQHPVGSNVRGSSSAWQVGGPLHETLDDYNNGELCAPHRG
jgi:SdrD B-like domain